MRKTNLSSGQASQNDGSALQTLLLVLLLLLFLIRLIKVIRSSESFLRDDLVGKLDDGSTGRVGEVLTERGVGDGEIPRDDAVELFSGLDDGGPDGDFDRGHGV